MVLNDDASYYTTLVYSCGYSYSFLPNLILCLVLLGLLSLVWLFLWIRKYYRSMRNAQGHRREEGRLTEAWLMNFTVRFLYEIYFEICLCFMINVSYQGGGSATPWWLCLALAMLAIAAPIAITVLFWKYGPKLKGSYERMSLMKSIWEIKPIT